MAPANLGSLAEPTSVQDDPFAPVPEAPSDDPFAAVAVAASPPFEPDPFDLPAEPAEALAQSLSPIDDPFAPPQGSQLPDGSQDALPSLAPFPQQTRIEAEGGRPALDLVGPLDLQPPGALPAAGKDLRAPLADLESLLGAGADLALPQTPGLALEGTPGLALDGTPGLALEGAPGPALDRAREPAFDRDRVQTGLTPSFEAYDGIAGEWAASPAAPRPDSSGLPLDFTRPAPAPAEAAAPRTAGPRRLPAVEVAAPTPAQAQRPKASAAAAALSLAFLVAAAAVTFVAWRGGLGANPKQAATSGIEAEQVTAGPYDTAAGTTVLVVRGRVTARERVAGPVQVEAQLWEHGGLVATAEGKAGVSATPEEVYASGTLGDMEALRRALDGRAAKGLATGESAPFLLLFPPPAPETRGRELRVVASAAAGAR